MPFSLYWWQRNISFFGIINIQHQSKPDSLPFINLLNETEYVKYKTHNSSFERNGTENYIYTTVRSIESIPLPNAHLLRFTFWTCWVVFRTSPASINHFLSWLSWLCHCVWRKSSSDIEMTIYTNEFLLNAF